MSGSRDKKLRKNAEMVFGKNVDQFTRFAKKQGFWMRLGLASMIIFKLKDEDEKAARERLRKVRRHSA